MNNTIEIIECPYCHTKNSYTKTSVIRGHYIECSCCKDLVDLYEIPFENNEEKNNMGADEFAVDMCNKSLFEDNEECYCKKQAALNKLKAEAIMNTNSTAEATSYLNDAIDDFKQRYMDSIKPPTTTRIVHDNVNHPNHYCVGKYECMDVMEEVFGRDKFMDYCYLNAFKYMWRSERKNGIEDIKKAIFYLNKFVEIYEKNNC